MALDLDYKPWRTTIIPVEKDGDTYTIKVTKQFWNDIQLLMLEGAKGNRVTLEFDIKK